MSFADWKGSMQFYASKLGVTHARKPTFRRSRTDVPSHGAAPTAISSTCLVAAAAKHGSMVYSLQLHDFVVCC